MHQRTARKEKRMNRRTTRLVILAAAAAALFGVSLPAAAETVPANPGFEQGIRVGSVTLILRRSDAARISVIPAA